MLYKVPEYGFTLGIGFHDGFTGFDRVFTRLQTGQSFC